MDDTASETATEFDKFKELAPKPESLNPGQINPTVEQFAAGVSPPPSMDVLRCISLPRVLAGELLEALQKRRITLDTLMPTSQNVARSIMD